MHLKCPLTHTTHTYVCFVCMQWRLSQVQGALDAKRAALLQQRRQGPKPKGAEGTTKS